MLNELVELFQSIDRTLNSVRNVIIIRDGKLNSGFIIRLTNNILDKYDKLPEDQPQLHAV
jgi:hypothetical protein